MAEKAHTGSSADAIVSGVYVQVSVPESKAKEAVTFYKEVFDAEEVGLSCCSKRKPDKEKLYCAELKIGGTSFLVCGDLDDATVVSARPASSVVTRVQVDDVDAAVDKADKAGAVVVGEAGDEDPCCGGRMARLLDPFGVSWDVVSPPQTACCG